MLLAIDTSTRYAGVALLDGDGVLQQQLTWRSRQNHTVELMPAVDTVLARAGATLPQLAGIAVALGPGSFSALRTAVSVAKGLAWAAGLPLVTATTLETEAYLYAFLRRPLCAVLDAGRGDLYAAMFQPGPDDLIPIAEPSIVAPEDVLSILPEGALLCGEGLLHLSEDAMRIAPPGSLATLPYLPGQRVAALGYLGRRRLQVGRTADPRAVQPFYLRRPSISQPKRSPAPAS